MCTWRCHVDNDQSIASEVIFGNLVQSTPFETESLIRLNWPVNFGDPPAPASLELAWQASFTMPNIFTWISGNKTNILLTDWATTTMLPSPQSAFFRKTHLQKTQRFPAWSDTGQSTNVNYTPRWQVAPYILASPFLPIRWSVRTLIAYHIFLLSLEPLFLLHASACMENSWSRSPAAWHLKH